MSQIIRSTQKLIGTFIIIDLVQFALVPHYVDLVDQLSLMFPQSTWLPTYRATVETQFFAALLLFFCGASPASKLFPCSVIPLSAAAHLHILRRSFFLQLSHKDGIKKVEHIGPCILASSNWNDLETQSCYNLQSE